MLHTLYIVKSIQCSFYTVLQCRMNTVYCIQLNCILTYTPTKVTIQSFSISSTSQYFLVLALWACSIYWTSWGVSIWILIAPRGYTDLYCYSSDSDEARVPESMEQQEQCSLTNYLSPDKVPENLHGVWSIDYDIYDKVLNDYDILDKLIISFLKVIY